MKRSKLFGFSLTLMIEARFLGDDFCKHEQKEEAAH
jgi:hypothetical protein